MNTEERLEKLEGELVVTKRSNRRLLLLLLGVILFVGAIEFRLPAIQAAERFIDNNTANVRPVSLAVAYRPRDSNLGAFGWACVLWEDGTVTRQSINDLEIINTKK